jgi:hypothetical protein
MEMKPYEVYIQTNENGYIVAVNSSEFLTNIDGWTKIDEGYGDKYHHAQNNYFDKPIYTESGVYRYKFVDGVAVECTAEEIEEQEVNKPSVEPSSEPSADDILNVLLGV